MDVRVLELVDGAREARGLTVVIDVFRAFTLECYLFAQGAEKIYPIGSVDEARALKAAHPDWLCFGERGGWQVEGFDFGNSPSQVAGVDLTGRTCIHTTSAGTQGIVNATGADEIVTIDHGRVAEKGTHDELLARGGTYARYYRMQFGDGRTQD